MYIDIIEVSLYTIFNMGYGSGKSPMDERVKMGVLKNILTALILKMFKSDNFAECTQRLYALPECTIDL